MTPKEKAQELVNRYKPYVYPYMGSGMLTNTEDDEVILMMAKTCAKIAVDEILAPFLVSDEILIKYFTKVREEIDNL